MVRRRAARLVALAVILGLGLLPSVPAHGARPSLATLNPQALDALLTTTRLPPRDLYALVARLKLHTTRPIDPIVNPTPVDYPVGHVAQFYIANGDTNGYMLRTAVLRYKTAHAYFYVQQGTTIAQAQLARSARTFEQRTYPTDRAVFGAEWSPGVDNDPHITIYNGAVPDVAGYFYAEDLYPRSVNAFSNQRKMIYINLGATRPGTNYYDEVLAHEFQHMIHYHLHPADDAWLNEGSSILAQVLNGYTSSGFDQDKATAPSTQLDAWDVANSAPYYGGGYLWMLYLYEQFGARAVRAELADRSLTGMALFDDLLAKLGSAKTADTLFADWVVANFLNDRALGHGQYGYSHTTAKAAPTVSVTLPFSRAAGLPQYAAQYIDIPRTGGRAFTLRFGGLPTGLLLNTVAPSQGFWWSNRADNVDTTLTLPPLDLRGLRHATLRYQAWYDLEQDYDYGYVEVSTDGGMTWYAQPTAHTTQSNPNGNNVGNAYTGSSCSAQSRAQHCWVAESVDLSPFAGKRILVRFEQVTDDVYNGQGLAIAHIRMPEAGFDGDSVAAGWRTAGWVRVGNTLAQHWIVQALVYRAGTVQVLPLPVDAAGAGSLRVPAGSSRVVVVVSAAAPLTTTGTRYTLRGTQ